MNDRTYSTSDGRAYPTTPSTFPQPIFPMSRGQGQVTGQVPFNEYLAAGQIQSPTTPGYSGNYFGQYPQQRQPMQYNQYQQQGMQSPQAPYPQRGGFATNDPNASLARQFSNQNLGNVQRQPSPFARNASPHQMRPRPGGMNGPQSQGTHLGVPTSGNATPPRSPSQDDEPPEPNPGKYSNKVIKSVSKLHVFVTSFFGENVTRARDRNAR